MDEHTGGERYALLYDQHEDFYDGRPSEFVIRQTRRACPDADVRLFRLLDGWYYELIEEWPALGGEPRGRG